MAIDPMSQLVAVVSNYLPATSCLTTWVLIVVGFLVVSLCTLILVRQYQAARKRRKLSRILSGLEPIDDLHWLLSMLPNDPFADDSGRLHRLTAVRLSEPRRSIISPVLELKRMVTTRLTSSHNSTAGITDAVSSPPAKDRDILRQPQEAEAVAVTLAAVDEIPIHSAERDAVAIQVIDDAHPPAEHRDVPSSPRHSQEDVATTGDANGTGPWDELTKIFLASICQVLVAILGLWTSLRGAPLSRNGKILIDFGAGSLGLGVVCSISLFASRPPSTGLVFRVLCVIAVAGATFSLLMLIGIPLPDGIKLYVSFSLCGLCIPALVAAFVIKH